MDPQLQQGAMSQIPLNISGEFKQATVLFADLVGSTALIADLDAEEAIERLRPAIAAMVESILRFDGTVLKTLGDGIMAVFGAPEAREEHALLACRAALDIRAALSATPAAPKVRIGLHSGEVVAGEFAVGSGFEPGAKGLTVHIASRLEQLAEQDSICLSRQTWTLVRPFFGATKVGVREVKGLSYPLEVFRLTGQRARPPRGTFRQHALTPFRGRDREMALLKTALSEASQGAGGVIGVSAPLGAGKTRLCSEFARWCRQNSVPVLEARAAVYGQAMPLQPVLEVLRSAFGVALADEAAVVRRKVEMRALALDPGLAEAIPLLSDFLGVAEKSVPTADPRARSASVRAIVARLLQAAGTKPWVLILEDLHWLDEASREFVDTLVDSVAGTHVLAVLNYRPPYTATWRDKPQYRQLLLSELDAIDNAGLIEDLVGPAPELAEIRAEIFERSGGNPFFVEALVQSLVESGGLAGERRNYRLGAFPDKRTLPATIEAAIGARIDQLPTGEKTMLQVAATIGREFPTDIVREVFGNVEGETQRLLAGLAVAAFIREKTTSAGRGFAFCHPLIQEVAYRMQLRARRAQLHARVAQAMERTEWGRSDQFAGLVGHHYYEAGKIPETLANLQRAARWIGRSNSAEALKAWKRIRSMLHDQPRSEANDRLCAVASGQVLGFGWREGMTAEEAKPYAEEALSYARSAAPAFEPILVATYGRILAATAAADEYVRLSEDAVNLTSSEGDVARFATVKGMLGHALLLAGRLREALDAASAALAAIESQSGFDREVTAGLTVSQFAGFDVEHWIKCIRARILFRLGRFREAEEWLDRLLQVHPDKVSPVTQFIPHYIYVEMSSARKIPDVARWHATQIDDLAGKYQIPYMHVAALTASALAMHAAGEYLDAAQRHREAIDHARRAKAGLESEAAMLAHLADSSYNGGEFDAALAWSEEAIAVARRRTDRFAECHAALVRALTLCSLTRAGASQEARDLLARADRLIGVLGSEFFGPRVDELRNRLARDAWFT